MAKLVKQARSAPRKKRASWEKDIPNVAQAIVKLYSSELPKNKKLDLSERSIVTLDQLITRLWGDERPSEKNLNSMIWAFGCYIGAVLQRNFDGTWSDGVDGYSFDGVKSGVGVSPWNWVASRFELGRGETLSRKYRLAKKLMSKDKK